MNGKTAEPLPTDGRRLRTVRNRQKIIDALLQLLEEGDFSPSAEVVADKAGVGLRSVFRHFEDMEALYREIGEALKRETAPLVEEPLSGETWRERLDALLARKIELTSKCMSLYLAGRVHRHDSLVARVEQQKARELERRALAGVLPREIARDKDLFEALDWALSIDSCVRLRSEQGLSVRRTRAVMKRTLDALLADCG